jgi:rhamnosyltransferase
MNAPETWNRNRPLLAGNMKFTVCIPTLNAREVWRDFAFALKEQTAEPWEVIVIDSESEDGTAELAAQDGFRVVEIARRDFRHGGTRQLAAEMAAGSDVLVYLTQDALLAGRDALSVLLRAFEDPEVGAAYGRQLPRKEAGPIEAHARLFNYPPMSTVRSASSIQALGLKTIFFSDSFGAYRRSALQAAGGFPLDANFGEDTVVAGRLVLKGWKIAYVAEAEVFHSHEHSLRQEFDRYRLIGELHAEHSWMLDRFGGASGEGFRYLRSKLRFLAHSAPYLIPSAVVRDACKYLGYKMGLRKKIETNRLKPLPEPRAKCK